MPRTIASICGEPPRQFLAEYKSLHQRTSINSTRTDDSDEHDPDLFFSGLVELLPIEVRFGRDV